MRLISQDGSIDIPYDRCVVRLEDDGDGNYVTASPITDRRQQYLMAVYSTSGKAIREMCIMRRRYAECATDFKFEKDDEL